MRRRSTGDPALVIEEVRTADLVLRFVPSVGGRLISLETGGTELLWRDRDILDAELRSIRPRRSWPLIDGTFASWTNLGGSKVWPAPQGWSGTGEWPGPPDAVLDAGDWSSSYRLRDDGAHEYRMTSPFDARTGLVVRRTFIVPHEDRCFVERIEFENRSTASVSWAPWEVCQIDVTAGHGDPRARIEVAGASSPLRLGDYVGRLEYAVEGEMAVIGVQDAVGKLGFPESTGTIRWRGPFGEGVTLRAEVDPDAVYPDGGARAEVWMQCPTADPIPALSGLHPRERVAEIELLAPLRPSLRGR